MVNRVFEWIDGWWVMDVWVAKGMIWHRLIDR